jgi:hypothetical protein
MFYLVVLKLFWLFIVISVACLIVILDNLASELVLVSLELQIVLF